MAPSYGITRAARLIGVHPSTMSRWASSGRIPCGNGPDGRRTIDGTDLARLAASVAEQPNDVPRSPTYRNRMGGIVTAMTTSNGIAQVQIQAGRFRLVALVTQETVDEIGLEVGQMADAVVKVTDVGIQLPANEERSPPRPVPPRRPGDASGGPPKPPW